MKKTLIITLVNGRVITRDISLMNIAPLGSPANDEAYAKLCQAISANGYTDPDRVTEESYTHIAPSQIQDVTITIQK